MVRINLPSMSSIQTIATVPIVQIVQLLSRETITALGKDRDVVVPFPSLLPPSPPPPRTPGIFHAHPSLISDDW